MRRIVSVGAVAAALSSPAAFAALLVDSASYANLPTDFASQALRVDLFDPSLGVLNKATVTISGHLSSSGTVHNPSNINLTVVPISVSETYSAVRSLIGPAGLPSPLNVFSGNVGQQTYPVLGPNATTNFGPFSRDFSVSFELTALSDLQGISGLGQFGYDFSTATAVNMTNAARIAGVTTNIGTSADASLQVVYDYTAAVPEPEAYALMLAGLGLTGFVARRRKLKAAQ